MTATMSAKKYDPVFNEFLYGQLDEGATGQPLSLLSAMTRLGVDPWLEAAQLTRMSEETASLRLAALIERLPSGTLGKRNDAVFIAVSLLKRLPRSGLAEEPTLQMRRAISDLGSFGKLKFVVCLAIAIYLSAVGAKWAFSERPDNADPPTATSSEGARRPSL